jgi:hypothetical protein
VPNSASTVVQGVPGGSYTFQQNLASAAPPTGLGSNRPARTLTGWMGGIVETRDPQGNVLQAAPVFGANALTLDPGDSRVQMNAVVVALHENGNLPPGAFETAQFQLGNVDRTQPAQSTYIDYENFAAVGAGGTGSSPSATLINGAPVDQSTLIMTSANTPAIRAALGSAFPNVNFCQCEYTRWGFWSASAQQSGFVDVVHLGTWVSGEIPANPQVPTTGTATYSGHVAATVRNGTSQYLAAGNLSSTINFGNPNASTAQVTNFDGRNFNGSFVPSSTGLFGNLTSGTGPSSVQMLLLGSFFRGSMHGTVGEMGGSVLINANTTAASSSLYTGSGIFAAKMTGMSGLGP